MIPTFAEQVVADAATALVHLAPIAPADPASDLDRLDDATRGTYHLLLAAAAAGVQTVVLGSTLDLLAAYPGAWHVTEQWAPRPAPTLEHLAPYLAECSARELARVLPLRIVGLRLGEIVDESDIAGQPFDGRWLHVDDAVQAVERAVTGGSHNTPTTDRAPLVRQAVPVTEKGDPATGWWVYHIPAAGPRTRIPLVAAGAAPLGYAPLGYVPQHDFRDHWTDDWQHPPAAPLLPRSAVAADPQGGGVRRRRATGLSHGAAAGGDAHGPPDGLAPRWRTSSRPGTSPSRRERRCRPSWGHRTRPARWT